MKLKFITWVVLSSLLSGCVLQMTKRQFETAWDTETTQISLEQFREINGSPFCKNLGEHEVNSMGFTVSHDVSLAGAQVDQTVRDLGGNLYYMNDFGWIMTAFDGSVLNVLFTVYKCDASKLPFRAANYGLVDNAVTKEESTIK